MVQSVLNRKHVAQLLSCSVGTVDNLVRRGELKYTRRWLGGYKCFTFEMVNEYVERLNARGDEYAKLGKGAAGSRRAGR
jgi:excisionase family DNA binding protein